VAFYSIPPCLTHAHKTTAEFTMEITGRSQWFRGAQGGGL